VKNYPEVRSARARVRAPLFHLVYALNPTSARLLWQGFPFALYDSHFILHTQLIENMQKSTEQQWSWRPLSKYQALEGAEILSAIFGDNFW